MSSKPIFTTSCTIRCPNCAKSMLLKNWKKHCQQMHTMSEAAVNTKYNELKENVEMSKLGAATPDTAGTVEKPCPLTTNTLFSMKKFALTKPTNLDVQVIDIVDQANQLESMELDIQCTNLDSTTNEIESVRIASNAHLDINGNNNTSERLELLDSIASTPSHNNILSDIDKINTGEKDETSNDFCGIQPNNDQSPFETLTTDEESEENILDNDVILSTRSTQNVVTFSLTRPPVMSRNIQGVKFITHQELKLIDTQRENHSSTSWFTDDKQKKVKPSRHWFSKDRQWLRAICTENIYGLICMDCIEFATNETLIKRSNGAFILRPYWKLKHKGLDGIKQHEHSDLHRESRERRLAARLVALNGNITGQLNCVNMESQTRKYLSVLLQTLWFIIKEEMSLMKFKPFIELLQKVECPGIVEWLNLSNVKQRYWSHEATSEWLFSINNYINQQQKVSLRQTEFINLIVDETSDISIKQMICICLRYVEKESGIIKEEVFKLGPIHDVSGEGIFNVIEEFITTLQKDVEKEFIITAQTYDGAAAMRFQCKGHVLSRLSAWSFYIYCRSHLLNLSIKDAIDGSFYDTFDTIKSALVFLGDSTHRIEILFNSQKLTGSSKKGHSVPKPSNTRWSYSYEILRFACQHYSAIILTFANISQAKSDGSSDGRRYAKDLLEPRTVFQIQLLRDVLRPAIKFLKQIEKRGACLDDFSLNVNAARETIAQAMNSFDFSSFRTTLNDIQNYAPVTNLTSHSTRQQQQQQSISADIDEEGLRKIGNDFIQHVLQALDQRFNAEAKEIIENLCVFSSPSSRSPEELINNPLIQKYTSPITYTHTGVDGKVYERTDQALLNIQDLKDDLYSFYKIVENVTSIPSILLKLAKYGSEQCPEWYRLYQILATFAVGSNEAERMFSTLRRIKSWLRNRLSDTSVEILLKLSSLDIQLTDEAINFIIQDFIKNPGRAKSRNVTLFFESDEAKQDIESF